MNLFYRIALILLASAAAVFFLYLYVFPYLSLVIFAAALLISIKIIYFIGVFHPTNPLFMPCCKGRDLLDSNEVTFRFDDGPDKTYTPQILDILKQHSIKAIFAVTGENCLREPEILKRIINEGHIIINHSFYHDYFISLKSKHYIFNDIQKCSQAVKDISGQEMQFYSPPIGHRNLAMAAVLKDLKLKLMAWDIRSYDTKLESQVIVENVKKELKEKSIILFHDAIYKWTKQDRYETIKAIKDLIVYIKNNTNYQFLKTS